MHLAADSVFYPHTDYCTIFTHPATQSFLKELEGLFLLLLALATGISFLGGYH